jgi:hypothetical protein
MSLAQIISLIAVALSKAPEIVGIIEDAVAGKLTYEEAIAKIAASESAGAAADAAADAAAAQALHDKFDTKTPVGGA